MVTNSNLGLTTARIANFYVINGKKLSENYIRLTSEKQLTKPADNIADYFRSESLERENASLQHIQTSLREGYSLLSVGESAGSYIYEDLLRMKELVDLYYDDFTSTEDQAAIEAEFNNLKDEIAYIMSNAKYDGNDVIQDTSLTNPLRSIMIDANNVTTTFDIEFDSGDVADASTLDITIGEAAANTAVQAELDKAGSYLAKVAGYTRGLEAQEGLVNSKLLNNKQIHSEITDVDHGREVTQMLEREIYQQSASAMLAQANMMQQAVLMLVM